MTTEIDQVSTADSRPPPSVVAKLFQSIIDADTDAIIANYLQNDELLIFLEGPESYVQGWDESQFRAAWDGLFQIRCFSEIVLTNRRSAVSGDVGWVAGLVQMTYHGKDAEPAGRHETVTRGSWLFKRHEHKWLIASEHVSFAATEPYPI